MFIDPMRSGSGAADRLNAGQGEEMSQQAKPMFEVVCVTIATTGVGRTQHTHIVAVGIKEKANQPAMISVEEARNLIGSNYLLYTVSPSTGKTAVVEPLTCHCGVHTLRSAADFVKDNNLDELARCD